MLAGSATAYSLTEYARIQPFLECCGFSSAYAANDWTFTESVPGTATCSIEYWADGVMHAFRGCVGDGQLVFEPGQPTRISWSFSGLMEAPVDATLGAGAPTPDYTDEEAPPLMEASGFIPWAAAVPGLNVFEHIRSIRINLRNALLMRQSVTVAAGKYGVVGFMVTNRGSQDDPGMECIIEAEEKDDDFWVYWLGRSTSRDINAASLTIAVGTVDQSTFTFTIYDLDIVDMEGIDFEGIRGQRLTCRIMGTSGGNDGFSLVAT